MTNEAPKRAARDAASRDERSARRLRDEADALSAAHPAFCGRGAIDQEA